MSKSISRIAGSNPQHRLPVPLLAGVCLLVAGCATAQEHFLDCSIARPDNYLQNRCPTVLRASEFNGCVSESDVDGYACVLMDDDLSFCNADTTTAITAIFDRSEVSLDCAGGIIDHGVNSNGGGRTSTVLEPVISNPNLYAPGIWFMSDRSLSDIQVSNCTIRRTGERGISMFRYFNGQLGPDGQMPDGSEPVGHSNVLFENLYIENVRTGMYLGNFSQDIVMDNLVFDGTDRIALYVEAGSRDLVLKNSVFTNNHTREALAFDSAYNSVIENNLFVDNREGAVNLYQNCGELQGQVCPIVRDTPPNGNRIVGNSFIDNGITGLQIASRQGRKHGDDWCAALDGESGRFQDTAQDNTITHNVFSCDEGTALVVMDGPNTVTNNQIIARDRCVPYEVSTGGLGRSISHTLEGLVFRDNTIDSVRPPRVRNLPDGLRINQ